MKILHLTESEKPGFVEVRAIMDEAEFKQLLGNLVNLCIFAKETITEPASAIQTGARHQYAKYILLPVRLRRQFKTDEYDFDNIQCGALKRGDTLYVIYEVPKRGLAPPPKEDSPKSSDPPKA